MTSDESCDNLDEGFPETESVQIQLFRTLIVDEVEHRKQQVAQLAGLRGHDCRAFESIDEALAFEPGGSVTVVTV